MISSIIGVGAASKKFLGVPFAQSGRLHDPRKRPSIAAFERYGICGQAEVYCREGPVPIWQLNSANRVVLRSGEFARPMAVLENHSEGGKHGSPVRACVMAKALGGGLPRRDIALGARNIVARYLPMTGPGQASKISLEPEENVGTLRVEREDSAELFIPIFAETTEICVEGVYLTCPSIADLSKLYGKTRFSS